MNLKTILEKSKRYPSEVMVKKVVHKGFTSTQDYLRYINDVVFGTKLLNEDLYNKTLTNKVEETYFDLSWQPLASKGIKDKTIEVADKSKNHIFNLLGSGNVKVGYRLSAKGLEGYRYEMRLSEKGYLLGKEKTKSEVEKVFQRSIEYEPRDWQMDFK